MLSPCCPIRRRAPVSGGVRGGCPCPPGGALLQSHRLLPGSPPQRLPPSRHRDVTDDVRPRLGVRPDALGLDHRRRYSDNDTVICAHWAHSTLQVS